MMKAWTAFWDARTARRQEKLRRSQQFESSFSERLAKRTTSSKIDVRCTSQPNVNSEDGKKPRRQTFSRFFQLWKGLRNSKRKSSSAEEPQSSVAFTIATEDILPKSQPIQQTQRLHSESSDHVVEMDGFVTHLCDVHRENEEDGQDFQQLDEDFSALKNRNNAFIEQPSNDEVKEVNMSETAVNTEKETKIQKKENNVYSTSSDDVDESSDVNALENNNGKINDGTSKESDVENDSGCGSSIHEIPCVQESSTSLVRLSFKSLGESKDSASRNEHITDDDKRSLLHCSADAFNNKTLLNPEATYNDAKHDTSNERHLKEQLKKSKEDEVDPFETLIQFAKQGMSHNALEFCEYTGNTEVNINTTLSSNPDKTAATVDDAEESHEDVFHVDSGVLLSSTNVLCIEKQQNSISDDAKTTALSCEPNEGVSGANGNPTTFKGSSRVPSVTKGSKNSVRKAKTGEYQARKLKLRKQKQVSFESPAPSDGAHESHDSSSSCETETLTCDATSGFSQETSDVIKIERKETFLSLRSATVPQNKEYTLDKLKDATNMEDSSTRQRTQSTAAKLSNMNVSSLETLHLPSPENTKRAHSFSATIRRKLSFRGHQSSDDSDGGSCSPEGEVTKNKQIKSFRSFRVNKKTKSTLNDSPRIWDLEGNEANGYLSTIDRILSEKTEEPDFLDVPFTIPEFFD